MATLDTKGNGIVLAILIRCGSTADIAMTPQITDAKTFTSNAECGIEIDAGTYGKKEGAVTTVTKYMIVIHVR